MDVIGRISKPPIFPDAPVIDPIANSQNLREKKNKALGMLSILRTTANAKTLAMMHTTLFGTVYIYQGQEIGMINLPKDWPLEEWKDVRTLNCVAELMQRLGITGQEAILKVCDKARDNARSPVQWTDQKNGGFSNARPWMRVSEDYIVCNVASQVNNPESVMSFWKEMFGLRKDMADGLRCIALNFSDRKVTYHVPRRAAGATFVKATTEDPMKTLEKDEIELQPYRGVIYHL
ncbi:hypothetical protein EHS25_004869 [Saitozyma podzolica]|uniref:Glycosyl hydrolase family 13 catalytic domain-containing protein n=1 Tax=Saitozyma podzolica TaxID=1890683 RepID=A0A427Y362_9TREE|nr:hypothetical protein EHS25_004869 [Saitozyma podzolica]